MERKLTYRDVHVKLVKSLQNLAEECELERRSNLKAFSRHESEFNSLREMLKERFRDGTLNKKQYKDLNKLIDSYIETVTR